MNDAIRAMHRELIEDMTSYMKFGCAESESDPEYNPEFNAGYSQEHVNTCDEVLNSFLNNLQQVSDTNRNAEIIEAVKTAVVELNTINKQCDGSMIETAQREQLCEIIISAAREAGLVGNVYDITAEWREW